MIKAFLFDMDGVLFDSMPNHATSWVEAMHRHGLPFTREEAYMNEGRTGAGTINAVSLRVRGREATEEECQAIYRTKSEVFNQQPPAQPMRGAAEVLAKVGEMGRQRIIVTGSGQVSLLDRLNLAYPGVFTREKMVTAYDVTKGKPDPEPYLKGLEKAGVSADEAVVIENAPLGVAAGHAAGIRVIAVNTGPLPDDVLREAGADVVLRDMFELYEKLKEYEE